MRGREGINEVGRKRKEREGMKGVVRKGEMRLGRVNELGTDGRNPIWGVEIWGEMEKQS